MRWGKRGSSARSPRRTSSALRGVNARAVPSSFRRKREKLTRFRTKRNPKRAALVHRRHHRCTFSPCRTLLLQIAVFGYWLCLAKVFFFFLEILLRRRRGQKRVLQQPGGGRREPADDSFFGRSVLDELFSDFGFETLERFQPRNVGLLGIGTSDVTDGPTERTRHSVSRRPWLELR